MKVAGVNKKVSDFIVSCVDAIGLDYIEIHDNIDEKFIDFIKQESMTIEEVNIFSRDVFDVLKHDNINLEYKNGIEDNKKIKRV